jgi:hypothetical protein
MMEIYRKTYFNKFRTEINYYFSINLYGKDKYYEVIYELIDDANHYYSKYHIDLDGKIGNSEKIENDIYRFTPVLFSKTNQVRRLAILSKFVLYIISQNNNIPIYKLPRRIMYYNNGNETYLSVNAFVKSTYKLIPLFEKIYHS